MGIRSVEGGTGSTVWGARLLVVARTGTENESKGLLEKLESDPALRARSEKTDLVYVVLRRQICGY